MTYRFSTSAAPTPERFDCFYEAVARSYVKSELSTEDRKNFSAELALRPVGNLNLSVIDHGALLAHAYLTSSSPDVVFVQFVLAGTSCATQDDQDTLVNPGYVSVVDPSRHYVMRTPVPTKHMVLQIPRDELRGRLGDFDRLSGRAYSVSSAEGAITLAFLRNLFAAPAELDPTQEAGLARQAVDLTALMLSDGSLSTVKRLSSASSFSRLRLHHAIETSLQDRIVACEDIAGMAGISARYANVLLSQEGTSLERLILKERLQKCSRVLADPSEASQSIGEIASRWGFSSASHFARAFKEAFGMSARDYRAIHLPAPASEPEPIEPLFPVT